MASDVGDLAENVVWCILLLESIEWMLRTGLYSTWCCGTAGISIFCDRVAGMHTNFEMDWAPRAQESEKRKTNLRTSFSLRRML